MIKDIRSTFCRQEVYEIYSLCMYMPTAEKFRAKAAAYANDQNVRIYGFYDANNLKGIIVVGGRADSKAEILGIAVKTSRQNNGIGARLIQYAAKESGVYELIAETDDDAVGFYVKCGFTAEKIYKTYNGISCKRYKCRLCPT